jgi:hypothetical protein
MHRQDVVDGERGPRAQRLDGPLHRLDVVEHLGRRDIDLAARELPRHLRFEQPAAPDLETFDAR